MSIATDLATLTTAVTNVETTVSAEQAARDARRQSRYDLITQYRALRLLVQASGTPADVAALQALRARIDQLDPAG